MATTPDSDVSLDFISGAAEVLAEFMRGLDPVLITEDLLKLCDRLGRETARYIAQDLLSGQLVEWRTGRLAMSMEGSASLEGGVPTLRVGVFRGDALAYAGVIDQGTRPFNPNSPYDTIRPKTARALAIPVGESLTSAGVPRYPGGPRTFPGGLKLIPFKNRNDKVIGGLFSPASLSSKTGTSLADVKAAYLLVTAVDIRPRFYLQTGLMKMLPRILSEISSYFTTRYE